MIAVVVVSTVRVVSPVSPVSLVSLVPVGASFLGVVFMVPMTRMVLMV